MRIRTKINGEPWFTTAAAHEGEKARLVYHVPLEIHVIDIPTHEPKSVEARVIVAWPESSDGHCTLEGEVDWKAADDVNGVLRSQPVEMFQDGVTMPTVKGFAATFVEESLQWFFD